MVETTVRDMSDLSLPTMTAHHMDAFCDLIYDECGISLTRKKKVMLASRLFKRLRATGYADYEEYYNYVKSPEGHRDEMVSLIDAISTNKTEFFRENKHFDFLKTTGLSRLVRSSRFRTHGRLAIWSAGCSTGEEPYTLAMVLSDFFSSRRGDFSILATDISSKVLKHAHRAVYHKEVVEPVPIILRHKYLMQGKGDRKGHYRVVPELREKVEFRRLNFIDADYGLRTPMDIIFCRNVIIYFDQETRIRLMRKFYKQLVPGGYLFLGHSETLTGISNQFDTIAPTIYHKPER